MGRRYFSSTAQRTTLAGGIIAGDTVITVGAVTGFPSTFPYTLVLDPDTASEEIVEVTGGSGVALNVTRGVDGTVAVSHSAGAVVWHGLTARDLDEPNAHIAAESGVHGVTGDVVGTSDTQTLTNKTIDFDLNTILNPVAGPAGPPGPAGADGADGLGVPAGGATGQLLAKASNADNDTEWVDTPDGLPSQTGNSGKYLTTNGSAASWAVVDSLPSQTGNNGKYLTTDGSSASWATVASGGGAGSDLYLSENYV